MVTYYVIHKGRTLRPVGGANLQAALRGGPRSALHFRNSHLFVPIFSFSCKFWRRYPLDIRTTPKPADFHPLKL